MLSESQRKDALHGARMAEKQHGYARLRGHVEDLVLDNRAAEQELRRLRLIVQLAAKTA